MITLVGESNPYGGDREYDLWPEPEGCTGWRLCHVILGFSAERYLELFDRTNLCRGEWDAGAAAMAAAEVRGDRLILLGRKVARAFGIPHGEPGRRVILSYRPLRVAALIPHPSGMNTWYNWPANVELARRAIMGMAEVDK